MSVGVAKPEVAGKREAKAAADRDARIIGDGRPVEVDQRLEPVLDCVAIITRRRGVGVGHVELGNVGAGAEMRALALDQRDQHVLARLDRGPDRRQRPPHRPRDRVAALRPIENDAGERRLEAQGYGGHEIVLASAPRHGRRRGGAPGVDQGQPRAGRPSRTGYRLVVANGAGAGLIGVSIKAILAQ